MMNLLRQPSFDTPCRIQVEQSEAHFHAHVELDGDCLQKARGVFVGDLVVSTFDGDQVGVFPHRQAVAVPVEREGPARQRLARVPFALAVVQEAARREPGGFVVQD